MIGIVAGIPLRADVSRKDRRVGDCVALCPEGLVPRKPTVHLNIRGKNEGSRLNGTRQVSPLRHPNFIERLLRNQGLGQVGVGIGPTRAVCNACRIFVHIEDTRAVGCEDMSHRIRPQGSDREDGRREYISGLARSDGACPTGIQKAAERTVCVGDKRWPSVRRMPDSRRSSPFPSRCGRSPKQESWIRGSFRNRVHSTERSPKEFRSRTG